MKIKVDSREKGLIRHFDQVSTDISISTANLSLGDVIICDDHDNELLIIERKSIKDLAYSIKDSRYEEQSYRLK